MPAFRLLFPVIIGKGEETRRAYREYRVLFSDTLTWRQGMGLPTQGIEDDEAEHDEAEHDEASNPVHGTHWYSSSDDDEDPSPDEAEESGEPLVFHLSQSPPPPDEAEESGEPLVFHLSQSPPPSEPSLPADLTESPHAANDDSAMNEAGETEHHRALTRLILEGKRKAKPDWDYTGTLKTVFVTMANQEKVTSGVSVVRRTMNMLMCIRPPSQESENPVPRGWAVLRSLIVSALNEADRREFPAYDTEQQAHFLLLDRNNEWLSVQHRRNLEGCSAGEVIEMLELIEERGWRDVILVASPDGGWVRWLELTGEVKVFPWGEDTI